MAAPTCNMRSALQSSPPSGQVCTSNASRFPHRMLRVPLSKVQSHCQTQTVSNVDNTVKHRQLLSSRSSHGSTPNSFLCRLSPSPTMSRMVHKVSAILYDNGARVSSLVQMSKPPAALGLLVSQVETPALIVDLEAFERNCDTLRSIMKSEFAGVRCRPHAKMHKCAEVAALQLEYLGDVASGVCAQTITEAEAMVYGGIKDVLVTNQIVTPGKIKRLAKIAKKAKVSVVVDAVANVLLLSAAMKNADASLTVLVEVNIGQDRCGVDTPAEAVALALAIKGYSGLEWGGIHAYHGGNQHIRSLDERKAASDKATARAREVVLALQAEGHGCPVVTGGGTGTFRFEGASGVFTELQPGSFFFGDVDYALNQGGRGGATRPEWEQAIFVATTVISASKSRVTAVVDAGSKAVSLDSGAPVIRSIPWLQYSLGGDEHGVLGYKEGAASDLSRPEGTVMPAVGQMLRLVPGHVGPTVNMHDWLLMYRGDRVQDMYRIGGRGAGC